MSREKITINTRDGNCPATVFRPDDGKPHPAVIFFMDALTIRPSIQDMAERLANYGYVVLQPDMFYRYGPHEPLVPKDVFATGDVMKAIGHLYNSTDNAKAASDTEAFIAYLDTRKDVLGKKIGTTGYCMGGSHSLMAAGTYPDRIAAAASFHGGNIANDTPLSPHLLAPKMKGFVYVAGADKDNSYPPAMAERMEKALTEGKVPHKCEIYEGALHGWTQTDFPIYNKEAAERHWTELTSLYQRTLF
jgi:carboxymethylenebutenolidase